MSLVLDVDDDLSDLSPCPRRRPTFPTFHYPESPRESTSRPKLTDHLLSKPLGSHITTTGLLTRLNDITCGHTGMNAGHLPPELWLRIASELRSRNEYTERGHCRGERRPAPGSHLITRHSSPYVPHDIVVLSSVCQSFHAMLGDFVRSHLTLTLKLEGDRVVHAAGARKGMHRVESSSASRIVKKIPLGTHVKYLSLALLLDHKKDFNIPAAVAQLSEKSAPLIRPLAGLEILGISYIRPHTSLTADASLSFAQALASLPNLRTLYISSMALPPASPPLNGICNLQTVGMVHDLNVFPSVTDIRMDPIFSYADDYLIPPNIFSRLRVLHWCPADFMDRLDEMAAQAEACAQSGSLARLEEFVVTQFIHVRFILPMISALRTPSMKIFGCLFRFHQDERDLVVPAARKAWPKLRNLLVPLLVPQERARAH